MDKFSALSNKEKQEIFQEVASLKGVRTNIIEKDFWVCWLLKQLYSIEVLKELMIFKGGTSLSKAYHLIERFSEDIDLTINRHSPYFSDIKNPMEGGISNKEKERRIDSLKTKSECFVLDVVFQKLKKHIKNFFNDDNSWSLKLDEEDKQTILFAYPRTANYGRGYGVGKFGVGRFGEGEIGYIKPTIRLEFGARGDINPHENKVIQPYISDAFPELLEISEIIIPTLKVERTFWEKVTILHALYHGSRLRDRMSRHYYDTYIIDKKGVTDNALQDVSLLNDVVKNKSLMFKDNKASYETAKIGELKLVPNKITKEALNKDYKAMQEMIMTRESPSFDIIINSLEELEERINNSF